MSSGVLYGLIEKGEWKQSFLNTVDFEDGILDGFMGIDELTNYDLVEESNKPQKLKKRKAEREDEIDVIEKKQKISLKKDVSKSKLSKKKQQKKKKKNNKKNDKGKVQDVKEEKKKKVSYASMINTSTTIDTKLDENVDLNKWKELLVPDPILKALGELGFLHPTPIQSLTLPGAIRDRLDIVGAAETGSGKTLAFGIPIISHILKDKEIEQQKAESEKNDVNEEGVQKKRKNSNLRSLIVTPTRELAIQIKNHLVAIAKYTDIKVMVVVGGMSQDKQERLLKRCPEIIVGTPGRLWELIKEGNKIRNVDEIRYLVIDEADRMVEKGHFEELSILLDLINGNEEAKLYRQVFVFSATLSLIHAVPKRVLLKKKSIKLTQKVKIDSLLSAIGIKGKPKIVDITRKAGTVETLQEGRINCTLEEKDSYLYYFLMQHPGRTIVFCNSIDCVRRLTNVMTVLRRNPYPLHASMQQRQRLKNLERFSANENGVLITTDVAQRGLDIPNVEHIIHYQIPRTSEAYVHRSGRTARASKEGISIMLIEPNEMINYRKICKTLGRENELPSFPINRFILKEVKRRVCVGQKLDKLEHRFKRLNGQNSWLEKCAKDMDIELDEANLNDLGDDEEISAYRRQVRSLRQELGMLLRQPLLSKGLLGSRYPTFGNDLNALLSKSNTEKAISIMKREKTNQPKRQLENLFKQSKKLKSKKKYKRRK